MLFGDSLLAVQLRHFFSKREKTQIVNSSTTWCRIDLMTSLVDSDEFDPIPNKQTKPQFKEEKDTLYVNVTTVGGNDHLMARSG